MAGQIVQPPSDVTRLGLARTRALGLMRGIRGRLGVEWCGKFLQKSSSLFVLSELAPTASVLERLLKNLWKEHGVEERRLVRDGERPKDRNRKCHRSHRMSPYFPCFSWEGPLGIFVSCRMLQNSVNTRRVDMLKCRGDTG